MRRGAGVKGGRASKTRARERERERERETTDSDNGLLWRYSGIQLL